MRSGFAISMSRAVSDNTVVAALRDVGFAVVALFPDL